MSSSLRRLVPGASRGSLRGSWRWSRSYSSLGNLTDRQAADAVRGRIDWKYCLGLELTDPEFDHTVLTGFRQRLIDPRAGGEGPGPTAGPAQRTRSDQGWRAATHRLVLMCSRRCAWSTGWSSSPRRCAPRWRRWPQPPRPG
ncbi:MAG: transposase [Pseudonocardiaceae bacterium]